MNVMSAGKTPGPTPKAIDSRPRTHDFVAIVLPRVGEYSFYLSFRHIVTLLLMSEVAMFEICRDCFYNHRTNPNIFCTHNVNGRNKIQVQWNDRNGRLETTGRFIRHLPENMPPHVSHIAMCDPDRGTCKQDRCTFAHGRAEQKAWNLILRERQGETAINGGCQIKQYLCQLLTFVMCS